MQNPVNQTFKIAVIPGDGIGKEVMPEGLRASTTAMGEAIAALIQTVPPLIL